MNGKRVLLILLAVFLTAAFCCGAASAFTVSKEVSINPSGSLVPGDEVTAAMEIILPKGTVDIASKISFATPLVGDSWTVDILKGRVLIATKHPSLPYYGISGFDLDYDADIVLRIKVTGTVSSQDSGHEISVLQVAADGMYGGGIQSYSSPKQFVYNSGNLNGELAVLSNAIRNLDIRTAYYQNEGFDVSQAQKYTEQARTKYIAADTAAKSADYSAAFANIEAGNALVKQAEMELAYISLTMSASNLNSVDNVITTLYTKGQNTNAKILETKSADLKNTYLQILAKYNAGLVPDAVALDTLAASSKNLLEEANRYLEGGTTGSLKLSSGWNFISVPKKLDAVNDTAAELFAGVNTEGKVILSYNAESKLWETLQEDTKIAPLNAYWIYSVDEITLTPVFDSTPSLLGEKTLKKGWNAVGLSANKPMPASVVFSEVNWRRYISWNAAGQEYDDPFVKGQSGEYGEENLVSLWKGGWVYVVEDGPYLGNA